MEILKIAYAEDKVPMSTVPHKRRGLDFIDKVILHRLGEKIGHTPEDVGESFADKSRHAAGSYTGGLLPYHFFIPNVGDLPVAYQLVPLNRVTPHARAYNNESIGVAVSGDFRKRAPTNGQKRVLRWLCTELSLWLGRDPIPVYGHTNPNPPGPGSSAHPNKSCPGPLLDVGWVRRAAAAQLAGVKAEYRGRDLRFVGEVNLTRAGVKLA